MEITVFVALIAATSTLAGTAIGFLGNYLLEHKKAKQTILQNEASALFQSRISAYSSFGLQYVRWCQSPQSEEDLNALIQTCYIAKMVASPLLEGVLTDILIYYTSDIPSTLDITQLISEFLIASNNELTRCNNE